MATQYQPDWQLADRRAEAHQDGAQSHQPLMISGPAGYSSYSHLHTLSSKSGATDIVDRLFHIHQSTLIQMISTTAHYIPICVKQLRGPTSFAVCKADAVLDNIQLTHVNGANRVHRSLLY